MNFYEKFKSTSRKWNCFSKCDVLGSYDFMTLTISLDSLEKSDFEEFFKVLAEEDYKQSMSNRNISSKLYQNLKRIYSLAFHEYTHFIDSTSTAWGLEFIKLLNSAYLTDHDVFGTTEDEFYLAKKFYDVARSLRLPNYYTLINNGVNYDRPWEYKVTSGKQFLLNGKVSNVPILFISFINVNNERIVRLPLSIVSILEVSAMVQEILYKGLLVSSLEEDHRCVEAKLFEQELLEFVYNPELTEYSVCAHLLANTQSCSDILYAYSLCEKVSNIVLNFPPSAFEQMVFSSEAKAILRLNCDVNFREEIYEAIHQKNRGFLFYLITMLLPRDTYDNNKDISEAVAYALGLLKIDFQKLISQSREYVEKLSSELSRSKLSGVSTIMSSSLKNFDARLKSTHGMYNFANFDLPPVLLGDGKTISASPGYNNNLKNLDIENVFDELMAGQLWVERFSEACI